MVPQNCCRVTAPTAQVRSVLLHLYCYIKTGGYSPLAPAPPQLVIARSLPRQLRPSGEGALKVAVVLRKLPPAERTGVDGRVRGYRYPSLKRFS
eukprot:1185007-Prorocentrum_minimum.AAC.4